MLHRLNGVPVDKETLRSAEVHEVRAIAMPVLSATANNHFAAAFLVLTDRLHITS